MLPPSPPPSLSRTYVWFPKALNAFFHCDYPRGKNCHCRTCLGCFFFPSPLMKTQVKSQLLQIAKKSKAINEPSSRTEEGRGLSRANLPLAELSDLPGSPTSWLCPGAAVLHRKGKWSPYSAPTHSHPHAPFERRCFKGLQRQQGPAGRTGGSTLHHQSAALHPSTSLTQHPAAP